MQLFSKNQFNKKRFVIFKTGVSLEKKFMPPTQSNMGQFSLTVKSKIAA